MNAPETVPSVPPAAPYAYGMDVFFFVGERGASVKSNQKRKKHHNAHLTS